MPFYLNNHSTQESIHYTPNTLTKMNNTPYYLSGITADAARFQKFAVDANHQLNPLEKLLAKQAISIRIADPIDRECELRCDCIDFDKDIAQRSVQCLLGCSYCGNLSNNLIFLNAESCKQNVHSQAEAVRNYRDGNCDRSW